MTIRLQETHQRGWEGWSVATETSLTFFLERAQAEQMVTLLKAGKPATFASREANK